MIYSGLMPEMFFCVDANDDKDAEKKMMQVLLARLKEDSDVFIVWPDELRSNRLDALPENKLSIT